MLRTSRQPATRLLAWLLFVLLCPALRAGIAGRVRLDFFFSPGCPECERVRREVFPGLEARYGGRYELVGHDMNQAETIPLLLAYQERCGNNANGSVSLVIDHTLFLSGFATISATLADRVGEALARRDAPAWRPPEPPRLTPASGREAAQARAGAFTLPVVIAGGLTDGFNPCAISTLIFFMSLLAVLKVGRRTRLLVGVSFIAASFAVYTGLGLGFLFAVRRVPHFGAFKHYVETAVGLCMVPLAALSFRDAFRFGKSGSPDEVTLKIPRRVKARIHAVMRGGLGLGGPVVSGALVGAAVTLLESVCTGQGYLPVLMYLVKAETSRLHAWLLLVLYNLLFVAPLAAVFVCFHRGMQINTLIAWSRRNLVAVKVLLGLFFSAVAILLLWPKG